MDPFENPFRPGAGTPPPALVGRDELIGKYSVALRRTLAGRPGKSVMPIGLRGVGKTVLLNRFHKMAQDEGLTVGFIEAPESGDFKRLLATRLRSTLLELDEGPVSRRLVGFDARGRGASMLRVSLLSALARSTNPSSYRGCSTQPRGQLLERVRNHVVVGP
jgi:hypothetical protein